MLHKTSLLVQPVLTLSKILLSMSNYKIAQAIRKRILKIYYWH